MQTAVKIPEVTDAEIAFGNTSKLLPKWADLTKDEQRMRGPFCEVVETLFYNGGKLSDYVTPKVGVDMGKVARFIRATLGDFGPKHEHKIGGIAHMLAKWCDLKKVTP